MQCPYSILIYFVDKVVYISIWRYQLTALSVLACYSSLCEVEKIANERTFLYMISDNVFAVSYTQRLFKNIYAIYVIIKMPFIYFAIQMYIIYLIHVINCNFLITNIYKHKISSSSLTFLIIFFCKKIPQNCANLLKKHKVSKTNK